MNEKMCARAMCVSASETKVLNLEPIFDRYQRNWEVLLIGVVWCYNRNDLVWFGLVWGRSIDWIARGKQIWLKLDKEINSMTSKSPTTTTKMNHSIGWNLCNAIDQIQSHRTDRYHWKSRTVDSFMIENYKKSTSNGMNFHCVLFCKDRYVHWKSSQRKTIASKLIHFQWKVNGNKMISNLFYLYRRQILCATFAFATRVNIDTLVALFIVFFSALNHSYKTHSRDVIEVNGDQAIKLRA